MTVIEEIAAERRRQVEVEGWTADHDDAHGSGEIAGAAACYAMHNLHIGNNVLGRNVRQIIRDLWPWSADWWKPKNHRADLVKTAALIIAEIERLDRLDQAHE